MARRLHPSPVTPAAVVVLEVTRFPVYLSPVVEVAVTVVHSVASEVLEVSL